MTTICKRQKAWESKFGFEILQAENSEEANVSILLAYSTVGRDHEMRATALNMFG